MTPQTHGNFDVVYSWGVLHHTGDMHRALTIAASLVKPGGVFLVALYSKTSFCGAWTRIKRWYTSASPSAQRRARAIYIGLHAFALRIKGQSFDAYVGKYLNQRGMDYYNDIHDWMGGYPYESMDPEECRTFFSGLNMQLEREFILTPGRRPRGLLGSGCDEYTFRRRND